MCSQLNLTQLPIGFDSMNKLFLHYSVATLNPTLQPKEGDSLKATLENTRLIVVRMFPKKSVEGVCTVLKGSVGALKGFPEFAKQRGAAV